MGVCSIAFGRVNNVSRTVAAQSRHSREAAAIYIVFLLDEYRPVDGIY
jgi:hypothetical protein